MKADGRWHLADVDTGKGGKHGRGDARIKRFADGEGGIVANWQTSETKTFWNGDGRQLTTSERADREKGLAKAREEAEAKQTREAATAVDEPPIGKGSLMTAFNVVRFLVAEGREEEFLSAHRSDTTAWPGLVRGNIIKTGEHSFCLIGEWAGTADLAAARSAMVETLGTFRAILEDQGEGRGHNRRRIRAGGAGAQVRRLFQ